MAELVSVSSSDGMPRPAGIAVCPGEGGAALGAAALKGLGAESGRHSPARVDAATCDRNGSILVWHRSRLNWVHWCWCTKNRLTVADLCATSRGTGGLRCRGFDQNSAAWFVVRRSWSKDSHRMAGSTSSSRSSSAPVSRTHKPQPRSGSVGASTPGKLHSGGAPEPQLKKCLQCQHGECLVIGDHASEHRAGMAHQVSPMADLCHPVPCL